MPYSLQTLRRDHHVDTIRNLVTLSLQLHLYHSQTQLDLHLMAYNQNLKLLNYFLSVSKDSFYSQWCRLHQVLTLGHLGYIDMLLLLISGNVRPNPGPVDTMLSLPTLYDFKNKADFGHLHVNVRSLFPNMIRKWAKMTNVDVMVVSETWLNKSESDNGYMVLRMIR